MPNCSLERNTCMAATSHVPVKEEGDRKNAYQVWAAAAKVLTFISCLAKWWDHPNLFPHFSHMYFFSSGAIWLIMWYSSLTLEGNNLLQWGQGNCWEWTRSRWDARPIVPFQIQRLIWCVQMIVSRNIYKYLEMKHRKFYIWFVGDGHHGVFWADGRLEETFHKYHNMIRPL